jgi:hypothetical protein
MLSPLLSFIMPGLSDFAGMTLALGGALVSTLVAVLFAHAPPASNTADKTTEPIKRTRSSSWTGLPEETPYTGC